MFTSFGRKRSTRVPSPMRRSFASSLYARSLWARSLWARSLRCEQLEDRRLLAQLTVTTDQDIVDLNDGETSLREAIFAANIVPGADEIVFDFGHDGPATILLTQGELAITDALTITGPGAGLLTIDASGSDRPDPHNGSGSRIFQISSNATTLTRVTLGGIQLTGGNVAGDGGAVHAHADLILNQVNVVENYATDTGGGVALFDGSLTIVDSTIHGNSTGSRSVTSNYASGGGVYAEDASVIIAGSVISDNTAVGSGGGILASRSTLHIIDSLFHGNSGHVGGAINTGGPSFRMVNSTVSGNWTTDGAGGGIRTAGTISSIAHSTITGNVADVEHRGTGPGDGIFVASNASLTLDHTIVAGNGSPSVETHDIVSTKPYIASFSLIGAGAEYLAPLANNGGPTLTHALLPGSPAINAGERSIDGIPQYDQRGEPFRRVAGGRIDIGAYERQSFVVDNLADESDGDYGPGDLSLREAVDLANKFVGADTIEFSPLLTGGTIMVKIGSLQLRDDVQIIGLGAEQLTIDNSLTQGPIFNVDDSKNTLIAVGMSGLTLTGSKQSAIRSTEDLTVEDMIFRGNSAVQGAGINVLTGAALSPAPKLTVRDCRFDDNHAISATIGTGGGGGISFGSRGGELLVENSVFVGNSAATNGGAIAIAAFGTVVNITDSDFIDNEATRGGAVSISDDNSKLATLTRVEIRENKAFQAGGGIYVLGKAVTIVDSQIVSNRMTVSPGQFGGGGGIYKQGSDLLIVTNSRLSENHSMYDGGGMALLGGRLDMTESVLEGNTAASRGGGMWLEQAASVDIARSTLSGNSAETDGGGLYSRGTNTTLRFFDSTISGNSADGSGGGLSVASGSFLLNKSTVSGNSAAGFGGGLVVARGTRSASIQQSTITNNTSDDDEDGIGTAGGLFSTTSPAINIRNTILAGNHDKTGVADDVSADYVSAYSLIGSGAEFLGPLADNGGPTKTHALLPGSPAINAGDPAVTSIPQFDQRGYPFVRFSGTAIDIGAFEAQPLVVDTLVDEDDGDYSQGDFSLREAIDLANRIAGANTIRFSPLLAGGTILLEQGELEISDAVEVVGLGAEALTIDAKQQSRIFSITATAGDFAFSGLKLIKGSTSAPAAAAGGGAIRSASAGLLNLDGVHFVGNRTVGTEASGGAVFAAGNVRVEGSQFLENFTTGNNAMGGAIYATGDMTITGSTFTANQTAGLNASGGAVFTLRSLTATGTGFVSNKTLGNNSRGGAINARSVAMEGTTVSGNSTNGTFSYGGGISIGLGERPNGMTSSSIVDSFIIDNYTVGASSRGGGVSTAGTITVERSTISGNFTFGGNARGGGLYAGVGILRDNAFTSNRTYGAGSYGGGVAGSTSYGWQISNSHFLANQTFGSNSHGGALAAGRQLTITGSSFRDNSVAIGGGGAIYASRFGSDLTISSSSFAGNSAKYGGAIASRANLTIVDSILSNNRATGSESIGGGAINQLFVGSLTILRSRIIDNQAYSFGGGGIRSVGSVTISQSEVSNNRVTGQGARGGGLWTQGTTTITDSTITGNQVVGIGGGGGGLSVGLATITDSTISGNQIIGNNAVGGGILLGTSSTLIFNSTISGNQITGENARGGGLYSTGAVKMQHSTVTNNRINSSTGEAGGMRVRGIGGPSSQSTVSHSIVAGNFVGTTASDLGNRPQLSYSLIGSNAGTNLPEAPVGSPDANGNLIGGPTHGVIDPLLAPLANNGGPTKTHALLPGSPAINVGDPAATGLPKFDQRYYPFVRVFGTAIDIGAFEAQPLVVDTLVDEDDGDYSQGDFSLREAIDLANRIAGANTIRFSPLLTGGTILVELGEYAITDSVEIVGLGSEFLTVDAQQQSRIFNVTATTGDFTFSGMTLANGLMSVHGIAQGGGAIRSASAGLLNLDRMHFVGNRTLGTEASGGAVFASGKVEVGESYFLENTTAGNSAKGGAIYTASDITIAASTFTANQTAGINSNGGAVFTLGTLTADATGFIINRTLGNNSPGGAINAMSVAMEGTTVSGNSTNGTFSYGGGISIGLGGRPSGTTSASIVDSFVIDNYTIGTNSPGGGISAGLSITLERSTISGNSTFGNASRGGGLSAYLAVISDSMVANNRTYGTGSSGGGVTGNASKGWRITGTSFIGNETFGGGSNGGAVFVEGQLSVFGSTFDSNSAFGPQAGGGAINSRNNLSGFLVESSTFRNNSASFGGAIASQETSTIIDSVLTGNRANAATGGPAGGGAIYQLSSSNGLTIVRSTIIDNRVLGQFGSAGGGIRAAGRVTIAESEISNNRAIGQGSRGGGVFTQGLTTITDSTISGNQIIGNGGQGGGLFLMSTNSAHSILNSTISGNQITGDQARGGGLYSNGRIELRHSTVTANRVNAATGQAGGLWVTQPQSVVLHSIVAGNFAGAAASDLRGQPQLSYSLVGIKAGTEFVEAPVGSPDANGNLIGGPTHGVIDPRLGPLVDNGGPTKTHALLPGSPALNAGNPALESEVVGVPLFDQRGAPFARIADDRIDMGAYELQPAAGLYNADFDGDGDVDGRDFLLWQRGYGFQSSPPDRTTGDATGNGVVEGNDLVVWQGTYGNGLSASGSQQSARQELRTESREPERSMAPWAVTGLDDARGRDRWYDDNSEPVSDLPANGSDYAVTVDRALDHWLPPRRFSADFGDIVTQRVVKRRPLG